MCSLITACNLVFVIKKNNTIIRRIKCYTPFSQHYDLVHHIAHVECINCIHEWRNLQFKVDYECQIFQKNFSWQFLFTLRVFIRRLLNKNCRSKSSFISFCNMQKNISSSTSSQQIAGKNPESK